METLGEQIVKWLEKYRKAEMGKMNREKLESPLILYYAGEIIACEKISETIRDLLQQGFEKSEINFPVSDK